MERYRAQSVSVRARRAHASARAHSQRKRSLLCETVNATKTTTTQTITTLSPKQILLQNHRDILHQHPFWACQMLISSVLTVKFLSLVARDMIINLNTSKRVASSLFTLGKSYLFDDHQKNQHALRKQPNDTVRSAEYLVHNWLDALFARAQMILLWHDRTSSCFILAVFLISFR